jgi:dipeptidyl aminopeptidase/acylaminoacyl peptidase
VLSPNYRGSSGRGFAFSKAISADWGHLEVEDVLGAVDGLIAQGLADPDRLVVGGWSYGGMMTDYVIASDTRFKAAVSIAGVANMLASYGTDEYVQWYEQELGLPWKGIDAYLKVSYPFYHADRIQTPTLFLCGEKDWNVPLVNSEQMYQALRSQGKDARLVIYPGAHHGIDAPRYRRDILERMQAWYAAQLGAPAAGNR